MQLWLTGREVRMHKPILSYGWMHGSFSTTSSRETKGSMSYTSTNKEQTNHIHISRSCVSVFSFPSQSCGVCMLLFYVSLLVYQSPRDVQISTDCMFRPGFTREEKKLEGAGRIFYLYITDENRMCGWNERRTYEIRVHDTQ